MSSGQIRVALLAGVALGLGAGAQAQTQEVNPAGTAMPAVAAEGGGSSVRIVRLSDVRGIAQLDRNTGMGYEPAFANIPIVAGAKLRTTEGVAEVEFEDNSTLRLTPSTEVRFAQLSRMPTGGTVTTVEVLKGTAYVSLEKSKGNSFTVSDQAAQVVLPPGAHVRLETRGPQARLSVFDGAATLVMGGTTTAVGKKESVELDTSLKTVSAVQGGTEEGDFDAWDKQGQQYHKLKANALTNAGGFGAFGANDLNYYGSFVDMPGCGSMWRPYFANAAWDPFGAGVWAWYPTAGYSWVSPYPWGWLPFHSGAWANCGAAGWGWRPGGAWIGLNNVASMRLAKHIPHSMPPPPSQHQGTLVPVNMKALAVSHLGNGDRFTFRENSAGLGVPRASFGNLHRESAGMERHGELSHGVSASGAVAPLPMHREGGGPEAARGAAFAGTGRSETPGPSGNTTMHAGWSGGNGAGGHGGWGGGGNSGGTHAGWSGGGGGASSSHGGWTGGGGSSAGGGHMGGGGGGAVSAGGAVGGGGAAAGGGHH